MAFASLKNTIYSWFTKEPLGVEHGGTGSNSVDVVAKIEELESAWDSVSQEIDSISQSISVTEDVAPLQIRYNGTNLEFYLKKLGWTFWIGSASIGLWDAKNNTSLGSIDW